MYGNLQNTSSQGLKYVCTHRIFCSVQRPTRRPQPELLHYGWSIVPLPAGKAANTGNITAIPGKWLFPALSSCRLSPSCGPFSTANTRTRQSPGVVLQFLHPCQSFPLLTFSELTLSRNAGQEGQLLLVESKMRLIFFSI